MISSPFDLQLAIYATKASLSRGRLVPEAASALRSPFQRDRDRILHSNAFRKMRNKTQVFIESEGDYYRTRLTHSLEVAQIARSMSRALGLDEDLTETIALAHDLGHTCFGHAGEEGLNFAMESYGGFNHNEQTFRILTKLEKRYARFEGLNLTWETLEGIAKHNGPVDLGPSLPTLRAFNENWDLELSSFAGPEAQIAALSDDIAYNTHDADDGFRAGLFTLDDMRELPLFGPSVDKAISSYFGIEDRRLMYEAVRDVVGVLIEDVLDTTQSRLDRLGPGSVEDIRHASAPVVAFSDDRASDVSAVHAFLNERMYKHKNVNEACAKAQMIVQELFDHYWRTPSSMPDDWCTAFESGEDDVSKARTIADYIAGMTDRYAIREHRRIFAVETIV